MPDHKVKTGMATAPRYDSDSKELVPSPDPTSLTTQQLLRETQTLKEILETRLVGMDRAIALRHELGGKEASIIDEKVSNLQKVQEEKFNTIQVQFQELDKRIEKTAELNQKAIDAALQASKEAGSEQNKSNLLANAKAETAFTKQIDLLGTNLQTISKGTDDKINDMKDRLTAMEGRFLAAEGRTKGIGDGWGYLIGAVGLIGGVIAIMSVVMRH